MERDGKQRNMREKGRRKRRRRMGEKEENLGQGEQSRRGSMREERGKINSSVFPQGHQQVTPAFPLSPLLPSALFYFFP